MKNKENRMLAIICIISVILGVFAVIIYIKRNSQTTPQENTKNAQVVEPQGGTVITPEPEQKEEEKSPQEIPQDSQEEEQSDKQEKTQQIISKENIYENIKQEEKKVETPKETEPKKTSTEQILTPNNSYCDTNTTPRTVQSRYVDYIYLSAVDSKGCVLINDKTNAQYIYKQKLKMINLAEAKKALFVEQVSNSAYSIKTDEITIKNSNGNIIGWGIQLIYSEGVKSGRYLLKSNDEWVKFQ